MLLQNLRLLDFSPSIPYQWQSKMVLRPFPPFPDIQPLNSRFFHEYRAWFASISRQTCQDESVSEPHFGALGALKRPIPSVDPLGPCLSCLKSCALACLRTIRFSLLHCPPSIELLAPFSVYLQSHRIPRPILYVASSPFSFSTPITPSTAPFTPAISSSMPIPPNTALQPT